MDIQDAIKQFRAVAREEDPAVLQRNFLESLLALFGFERGSIWIKTDTGYLCIESAGLHGESIKGTRIDKSQPSIVGWVIHNSRLTVADPLTDKRHYKAFEEKLLVKSQLILCFPLRFKTGRVYGAVQVIDTAQKVSALDLNQLDRFQVLIDLVAAPLSEAVLFNRKPQETARLQKELSQIRHTGMLIGISPAFQTVREKMDCYAPTGYPVLITGASGTGKELVAQALHNLSPRRQAPFLTQNCSAIPETLLESELFGYKKGAFSGATRDKKGLFEAASGGSVFLDEIGEMSLNLQASILRVVQNSEVKPVGATDSIRVDVRIIAATNRDIRRMVAAGQFRQDLYYRLAVLPLHMPPLSERREDVPLLFDHFMTREALKNDVPAKQMHADVMGCLMDYHFPGNIRELENLVRYLLVTTNGETIYKDDLPAQISGRKRINPQPEKVAGNKTNSKIPEQDLIQSHNAVFEGRSWNQVEREYVHYLLAKNNWHVTHAAAEAGVKRSTFASRMLRLGISRRPQAFAKGV